VGDADNDGDVDVLISINPEPVYGPKTAELRLYSSSNGVWSSRLVSSNLAGAYQAAIGDADGDGTNEIVAGGYNAGALWVFRWSSSAFVRTTIDQVADVSGFPAIGDAKNIGSPQVYLGTHTQGSIYEYRWTGTSWQRLTVAVNTGYIAVPFVADLGLSGRSLLIAKYGGAWGIQSYESNTSSWTPSLVESAERQKLKIADTGLNGAREVIAAAGTAVFAYKPSGSSWARRSIVANVGFSINPDALHALTSGQAIVVGQINGGRIVVLQRAP
jgi:hypothetical protein